MPNRNVATLNIVDTAVWNVEGIDVLVTRKKIKTVRFAVYPPCGEIKISVPYVMSRPQIYDAIVEKLPWLKKQRQYFLSQPKKKTLCYTHGEQHLLWGQLYRLAVQKREKVNVRERKSTQTVVEHTCGDKKITVNLHNVSEASKVNEEGMVQAALDALYKDEVKRVIPELLTTWLPIVNRDISFWGVRKMKTRWGSCNTADKRIWLNTELAKYSRECLEYVLVHELVHLYERHHNRRFYSLMDHFLPSWRECKAKLELD